MLSTTMAHLRSEWRHDIAAGLLLIAMLLVAVAVLRLPGQETTAPAVAPAATPDVAAEICTATSLADC